jgi:5-(carboxyamino)imidazole ribonucleotide synthase
MIEVAVLGGGQLGRMLALAGHPLGIKCVCIDPAPDACAGQVTELITASYADVSDSGRFDAVTFEFENVDADAPLLKRAMPPAHALRTTQDRVLECSLFEELGIPTPAWAAVETVDDLVDATARIGFPCVLKSRRLGYDGKGQQVLRAATELPERVETHSLLQEFVPFQREVSAIGVRSAAGETAFYPICENTHVGGILDTTVAAAEVDESVQKIAHEYVRRILDHFDYVGVLALEMFESEGGLVANEIAPRVHNTGHWTIEGAETSQFENHLRAVLGWPLGSTAARGHSTMANLIGSLPDSAAVLAIPGAHLHLYGKEPKPGRKVGHVTVRADSRREAELGLAAVLGLR